GRNVSLVFTLTFQRRHTAAAVSSSSRSAGAPSSPPFRTRARHAGNGSGAQALSDGVSGFPSRLSPVASRPSLRSSAHRPVTQRSVSGPLKCSCIAIFNCWGHGLRD
ncbi:Got1/Sft2-like vescicle transport protein family, partial [Zea mays]